VDTAAASEAILIVGGGPAGTVLAGRLARQGHAVTLVGAPRAAAWEGLSPRVVEALRRAGCAHAAEAAGVPARRLAHWNGATSEHNEEYVLARAAFDAALKRDAQDAGVTVVAASVARLGKDGPLWAACDAGGSVLGSGRFLVEARGRRAPAAGRVVAGGPRTVAVVRSYRGAPPERPVSAAASFPDGWAWMAAFPDGTRVVQFLLSADAVPMRAGLIALHEELMRAVPEAADWVAGATPVDSATTRDATATLRGDLVEVDYLRVGDAAVTIDPLSGNGVFEALRGAFAASAAVATLLASPDDLPLVRRFVEERASALFHHAAEIGRAFYRGETRWTDRPFWRERAGWPAAEEPADNEPAPAPAPGIRAQAVVVGERVAEREVLVTPQHPRGVLTIAGVELAPLLKRAQVVGEDALAGDASTQAALAWLKANRFLERSSASTGP